MDDNWARNRRVHLNDLTQERLLVLAEPDERSDWRNWQVSLCVQKRVVCEHLSQLNDRHLFLVEIGVRDMPQRAFFILVHSVHHPSVPLVPELLRDMSPDEER